MAPKSSSTNILLFLFNWILLVYLIVFTECNQHCSANATDCPNMMCSGTVNQSSSCGQYCLHNQGRCKMQCYDVPLCIQECSSGSQSVGCEYIQCAADTCIQSCANCTMECTEDVKKCEQTCLGGKCISKCSSTECKFMGVTTNAPGTSNSHMLLGGYFSNSLLPTLCLIMRFM